MMMMMMISSSRIQMGAALGHTLTPLCCLSSVFRLHPRWYPCPSNLVWWCPCNFSVAVPAFSCSPSAWRGILESSILSTCPSHQ